MSANPCEPKEPHKAAEHEHYDYFPEPRCLPTAWDHMALLDMDLPRGGYPPPPPTRPPEGTTSTASGSRVGG